MDLGRSLRGAFELDQRTQPYDTADSDSFFPPLESGTKGIFSISDSDDSSAPVHEVERRASCLYCR